MTAVHVMAFVNLLIAAVNVWVAFRLRRDRDAAADRRKAETLRRIYHGGQL